LNRFPSPLVGSNAKGLIAQLFDNNTPTQKPNLDKKKRSLSQGGPKKGELSEEKITD